MAVKAERRDGRVYVPVSFFERFFFVTQGTGEHAVTLESREPENPVVLSEFMKLEDGDWAGLTIAEKQEDLEYLYSVLEENYPYFPLLKRVAGVDFMEEYGKAQKAAAQSMTDADFFVTLERLTGMAGLTGHLSVIAPFEYDWFVETYENMDNIPESYQEQMKKFADAYGNEASREAYDAMMDFIWPVYQKVMDYYTAEDGTGQMETEIPNVETKILKEGEIAYAAIHSFDMAEYEESKETLFDFYEQVQDYGHVIFDLTGNGGGGSMYFDDLIAAPNLDEPLRVTTYLLMKDGAHNISFMGDEDFSPVSELPDLPRMNREDLQEMQLALEQENVVEPLYGEKKLKGKIWMLVDGAVFSSSEYAAMMAKASGFATLVGMQTGGDGIGSDPLPIVMPNSSLIVRYSPLYGTTEDGASSQEFGTEPDIPCKAGETPLEACLRAIAAGQW